MIVLWYDGIVQSKHQHHMTVTMEVNRVAIMWTSIGLHIYNTNWSIPEKCMSATSSTATQFSGRYMGAACGADTEQRIAGSTIDVSWKRAAGIPQNNWQGRRRIAPVTYWWVTTRHLVDYFMPHCHYRHHNGSIDLPVYAYIYFIYYSIRPMGGCILASP